MNAFEIAALVIVCIGFVAAVAAIIYKKVKHKGCDCCEGGCAGCNSCKHSHKVR